MISLLFPLRDTNTKGFGYHEHKLVACNKGQEYNQVVAEAVSCESTTFPESYPQYFSYYYSELSKSKADSLKHYDPCAAKPCYPSPKSKPCQERKPCPKKPCHLKPCALRPAKVCELSPERKPCQPKSVPCRQKKPSKPCSQKYKSCSKPPPCKPYPPPCKPCPSPCKPCAPPCKPCPSPCKPCPPPCKPCPPPCKPCPPPCKPSSPCPEPCPDSEPCLPTMPTFDKTVSFGCETKKKHFFLEDDWVYFNQGTHGCTIKEVMQAQIAWKEYVERQPTKNLKKDLVEPSLQVKKRLAKFIGCGHKDLVFAQNVTAAIHVILQSLNFKRGDEILVTNFINERHNQCLKVLENEKEVGIKRAKIDLPVSGPCDILQSIKASLTSKTKLVIVDHISCCGVCLPLKEIVCLCHHRGIQVLVDGTHCLGPVPLDMKDIDADYYVTCPNQWLGNGKGCAIVYVRKSCHDYVRPHLVPASYCDEVSSTFISADLMDYSAFLSISVALDFWKFYGVKNIRNYMHSAAKEAGDYLAKAWGTSVVCDWDMIHHMVMVKLPDKLLPASGKCGQRKVYDCKDAQQIENKLRRYKIEVPVVCVNGSLYVIVSMNIYHCKEDYRRLAKVIKCMRQKQPETPADESMIFTVRIQKC